MAFAALIPAIVQGVGMIADGVKKRKEEKAEEKAKKEAEFQQKSQEMFAKLRATIAKKAAEGNNTAISGIVKTAWFIPTVIIVAGGLVIFLVVKLITK